MSWQDRDYHRQYGGGRLGSGLLALMNGSVPLGTWFGIRVRLHASLIFFAAWMILFPFHGKGDSRSWLEAARWASLSMGILFATVLLHEFGHCVAARLMGGFADEVLLWPLGGLAFTSPPHRPLANFVTSAGGPLVNVILCIVTGAALWFVNVTAAAVPWNPLRAAPYAPGVSLYLWLIFIVNYSVLLFNLLPIFPLDGGQMLQAILWSKIGYYRSMSFATITGMVGASILAAVGLVVGNWLLIAVAIAGFWYCYQRRAALREMGPDMFEDSAQFEDSVRQQSKRRHFSKRMIRKVRRTAAAEQAEQERIDAILAKVSAQGMHSLTWRERRTLRKATERQRESDMEMSRPSRD